MLFASPTPLASRHVPQANRVRKVLELVHALLEGAPITPEALGLRVRELRYHEHAARVLDLLDEGGALTERGRALAGRNTRESLRAAAAAFEESEVALAWVAWAGKARLREVDPASASAFLVEASELADSTAERRAMTLSAWWEELMPLLEEPAELAAPEAMSQEVSAEGPGEGAQLSLLARAPIAAPEAAVEPAAAPPAAPLPELRGPELRGPELRGPELRGEALPVRALPELRARLGALPIGEALRGALEGHLERYADLDRGQRGALVGALEALERGELAPSPAARAPLEAPLKAWLEARLRLHEV